MKTKFIFLFAALLFLAGCATEFEIISSDVPMPVHQAFGAKYHDAKEIHWKVERDETKHLVYEAEFKLNGKKMEAEFKPDGTFIKEE